MNGQPDYILKTTNAANDSLSLNYKAVMHPWDNVPSKKTLQICPLLCENILVIKP